MGEINYNYSSKKELIMSTSTIALVGDACRVDFTFTLLNTTTLADPDVVKIFHRHPDLSEDTYTYGVDPEITRLGEGQFRFETVIANEPRRHYVRTWGSDEVDKAQEVYIDVEESFFLDPLDQLP